MSCIRVSPPGCVTQQSNCPDCYGCVPNVCPNFQIKRFDTKPPFRVSIEDENGPMDLTGLVIEANMWASGKLKKTILPLDVSLSLADNIGYCQILVNDVIVMQRTRSPEQMRIIGFDESNSLVLVERGFNGTVPQKWDRGTVMRIFRIMNGAAMSEMLYDDVTNVDGTVDCNVLSESLLVYDWNINDTCSPGCFSFEFKVLKMSDTPVVIPSVIPACYLGTGVEWSRRYPTCSDFIVKICDTPTMEIVAPISTT